MNTKEKAQELMDFYNSILINYIQDEFERKYAVIECVLKAVDELVYNCYEVMKPFWQEVKEEIEKL